MFTVITEAIHKEMALLETVKTELKIAGSTNDGFLTELIQQASDFICTYTGRCYAKETVEETFQSRGINLYVTQRYPLVSISYITDDGTSFSSTAYEIDNSTAGIVWAENGFRHNIITDIFVTERPSRHGRRDWLIRYVAGYNMPGTTGVDRDFPHDLERACIDLIKSWYLARVSDPLIQRQQTGDASETRFATSQGAPPAVLGVLKRWRKLDL